MFPRLLALSDYHIMGPDIFKHAPGQIQTKREDSVEECKQMQLL